MRILQLNSPCFSSPSLSSCIYNKTHKPLKFPNRLTNCRGRIRAVDTSTSGTESHGTPPQEEPPSIDFAFVHSVLLPDGTPDIHLRSACGGQKLRDIMLDGNIDLYGPYDKFLLNCGGCATCGTCMVEVLEGKELLSPRTDKEKEILKRKPKNWRLACQTVVGKEDSRGQEQWANHNLGKEHQNIHK